MTDATTWAALARCAGWEHLCLDSGPLAHVLLHVVQDPVSLLRADLPGAARASVRLALRDGAIFGATVSTPRAHLLAVLRVAGATLAGQRHDESTFGTRDAELASALLAAGLAPAQITLEHRATLLPRPRVTPHQLGRMALQASGAGATVPPDWASAVRHACSFDHPAVAAYSAALDGHAIGYCGSGQQVHGVALDRLAVYNLVGAPHGQSRNRAQALVALPWLLPLLAAGGASRWSEAPAIEAAIDAGAPLHDAVARAFAVPRETVRWLCKQGLPRDWALDVPRMQRLLALLAWLPPVRRPRDAAAWLALTARATALSAPFAYRRGVDHTAGLARIAACMRHWLAHATPAIVQQANGLADAKDFLRALFESACSIDRLDDAAADARVLRWCAGIRAPRLLALSQAWHALIAHAADPGTAAAGARWPAVLASGWQDAHRTVVELTGQDQLGVEGQRMGHCIGSYASACRSGNSMVVSLRSASGEPVSTAQLYLVDGVPAVVAGQHRAARNAMPGPDCVRSLAALLRHLNRECPEGVARRRAFQVSQAAQRPRLDSAGAQFKFSASAQQAARRLAFPED